MIHQELKQLIDFAIQKGEITEKDREILHRKAAALGQDIDELDMFIEAEVHVLKKSPPTIKESANNVRKYKKAIILFLAIAILSLLGTIGFFSYRNSLIEKSLNQFKSTGQFDKNSLENAKNLSSEYSAALLGLSYDIEDDSLAANSIFSTLRNSTDWRVIALSNRFFNETNQISVVQKGLDEAISNDEWFWCHMKAIFICNKNNGYEYDKKSALKLVKNSADKGCVSSMRIYGQLTDDVNEKYIYYQKVINSEYNSKEMLAGVYEKLARMTINGEGCKADDKLFFNYASKAAELGSPYGVFLLGWANENGKGTPVDSNNAFRNYSKAAEKGSAEAIYALALCYKRGFGVAANNSTYKEKLNIAADKGLDLAIKEKEELRNQEAISLRGGQRQCACCGNFFNAKYGWGYDYNGPYSNQRQDYSSFIYGPLLNSMGFHDNGEVSSSIKYCTKKCAWDCGNQ